MKSAEPRHPFAGTLDLLEISYECSEDATWLFTNFIADDRIWGFQSVADDARRVVTIAVTLGFVAPAAARELLPTIVHANFARAHGHFTLNPDTGELQYRDSSWYAGATLPPEIGTRLFQAAVTESSKFLRSIETTVELRPEWS